MKNEPAFPTQMWDEELKEATWLDGGLTKRELFAAMAMQGILANTFKIGQLNTDGRTTIEAIQNSTICEAALGYADALIAELEKTK